MHRTIEEDRNSVTVTAGRASPIAKVTVVNGNAVSDHRNTVYLTPAGLRELAARLDEAADTIEAEHEPDVRIGECRGCGGDKYLSRYVRGSCHCAPAGKRGLS